MPSGAFEVLAVTAWTGTGTVVVQEVIQDANVERLDACPVRRQPCDEVQDRSDALARQARGVTQGLQPLPVVLDDARARFAHRPLDYLVLDRRYSYRPRPSASLDRCNAGDISTPAPHKPALSRGETRGSQVPGPSSSCVPWSTTPPGATTPRPFSVWSLLPSGFPIPWAPGRITFFRGCMSHGPLARVPTLRRIRYRPRRKARLTLGRAGFAPAG